MARGVRSGIDVGRLSAAASRPGIDPRKWVVLATVTQLGFDPEQGPFADVVFQDDGTEETCLIGSTYAGDEFGDWADVEVNDTVLLAIPGGDPGNGPVLICRMWNGGDPPFEEMGDGNVPITDRILRVKPGKKYKIRTSDSNDGLDFEVEGDGKIVLKTAQGLMELQGATSKFVRGEDLQSAIENFGQQVVTAFTNMVPIGGPTTPVLASNVTAAVTSITVAYAALQAAAQSYLSTRIKGE